MEDAPLREIKPIVVPLQYFVMGPLVSGFISIFPGFFVFVISNMIAMDSTPVVDYGVKAYVASFWVCMVLLGIKVFYEPSRTTYAIFPNRIEYQEGLWNRNRRTLFFDQVIDIEFDQGVLQQTRDAGTITLITQQLVSQGEGKLSNLKIALHNVPDPKEIYELIRSLALSNRET